MELVPIVITVLEIVTVLALLTLTISYFLFRIRQKTQPSISSKPEDMKPQFVGRGLKRLTQMTREILPLVKQEEPKRPPVQKKRVEEKRSEERRPQERKSQSREKRYEEKRPDEQRIERKEEINSRRIEVMKNLSNQNLPSPQKEERELTKQRAEMNSLGNDILDKYVDEDTSNLFALKTNKKEENKK
jgi:hypothetical protein